MHSVAFLMLLSFVVETGANEQILNRTTDATKLGDSKLAVSGPMDNTLAKMVEKLSDRALEVSSVRHKDLDGMVFAKPDSTATPVLTKSRIFVDGQAKRYSRSLLSSPPQRLQIATAAMWDPFAVLGVPLSATKEDIKTAYRKKVLEMHPDVSKERGATERFIELQEAYHLLAENGMLDRIREFYRREYRRQSGAYGTPASTGDEKRVQNNWRARYLLGLRWSNLRFWQERIRMEWRNFREGRKRMPVGCLFALVFVIWGVVAYALLTGVSYVLNLLIYWDVAKWFEPVWSDG
eukprot:gnl/TRDRNA2_/TRDRNA2_133016_c0_seq1.p1 gnl/TRDRNA2_/TRDRNA2_133016_c0~~gnl/TRDRNA2_/TRDRNA2_133016_c0_seq1.p1  ORF type:complete len:310 (+),score=39.19 gnl/TRDRNA2_/TRDRNA2_133016_c0_seq1:52-930(+)